MTTPSSFNQDDGRERAMVAALNLDQRIDRARHEEDAHAVVYGPNGPERLLFELKSAPVGGDFGTGRDTGTAQLTRWSSMHFVFGWFSPRDNLPKRMWYGSPAMMAQWINGEIAYTALDLDLAKLIPLRMVGSQTVYRILGAKEVYTYADMHRLMKDQWNASTALGRPNLYLENADVLRARSAKDCLYSPRMARRAIRDRVRYLLERGSTVNNRKISQNYVTTQCNELSGPQWATKLYQAAEQALRTGP